MRTEPRAAGRSLRAIAVQGDSAAQFELGLRYQNGVGTKKDLGAAFRWIRRAALQGHPEAQLTLGIYYQHGLGVRRSYFGARKWYGKAAAQGNSAAEYSLGVLYFEGLDVSRSPEPLKGHGQGLAYGPPGPCPEPARAVARVTRSVDAANPFPPEDTPGIGMRSSTPRSK